MCEKSRKNIKIKILWTKLEEKKVKEKYPKNSFN